MPPFAAVSSQQQSCGFHGTSIQAVEPLSQSTAIPSSSHEDPSTVSVPRRRSMDITSLQAYQIAPSVVTTSLALGRSWHRYRSFVDDFNLGRDQLDSIQSLRSKVFLYMMMKTVSLEHVGDFFPPGLRDFFRLTSSSTTRERSVVYFVDLNSKPADKKETLLSALATLREKHGVGKYVDFLVVAGDGKTFDHLINLKREYGEEFQWMLPCLGELHLLKNVQVPIFKVYLDGDLSQLLWLYHKGATSAAVSNSTCFDKSHTFLLQAWKAFFCSFISFFLSESNQDLSFLDNIQAAS